MNLRDLFTHLCTVSVKTSLLTLRGLFYLRFFHLILSSNPGNLTFYRCLLGRILFLRKIQLLQFLIYLLYFSSFGMPMPEFLQRIFSPVLFGQQHLQTFVRVVSPAVESLHNLIPVSGTFFFQALTLYLKFGLFLIICFFLHVPKRLTCIFQFTSCNVVLFFYRCISFQQIIQ